MKPLEYISHHIKLNGKPIKVGPGLALINNLHLLANKILILRIKHKDVSDYYLAVFSITIISQNHNKLLGFIPETIEVGAF
jgi:hypothetical protein